MTDEIPATGKGERGVFYWHWDAATQTGELREKPKKIPLPDVNAPYVKRDEIVGGIESWVDGKTYDSKSNLRRSYKEQGVVEKDGFRLPPPRQQTDEERYKEIRADTEKAFYDIKYGRAEVTEWDKRLDDLEKRGDHSAATEMIQARNQQRR